MKSIVNYLFIAIFLVGIVGCSDDDASTPAPDGGSTSGNLEGEWTFESAEQKNGKTYMDDELFVEFHSTSKNETGFMHFKADGQVESKIGYTVIMTTIMMGIPQTEENTIDPVESKGTYTYNSNTKILIITQEVNSEELEYQVLELTANKLVLKYELDLSVNSGGANVRNVVDNYITLSR